MRRFGSRRSGSGSGRLSVENWREKRVAGKEVVDALGMLIREARIELNEFRGPGIGDDGGSFSSGVVTIMVIGARREFWKIVDVFSFRRFSERES